MAEYEILHTKRSQVINVSYSGHTAYVRTRVKLLPHFCERVWSQRLQN